MNIGIVNYSLGNVGSVYSAFEFYKHNVMLLNEPSDLDSADLIVLAGVGNFQTAASRLKELNFWEKLNRQVVKEKKPVLGICLGMQLFADTSDEGGQNQGFGWIEGKVVKLNSDGARIPHIGWDEILTSDNELFKGIRHNSFYFMHSFHFIPKDKSVVRAMMKFGNSEIVVAVKKDNIIGVQFHPEKSQSDGLRFLKNIVQEISK